MSNVDKYRRYTPQRWKNILRTKPHRKRMKMTRKTSSYLKSMTTAPDMLGSMMVVGDSLLETEISSIN